MSYLPLHTPFFTSLTDGVDRRQLKHAMWNIPDKKLGKKRCPAVHDSPREKTLLLTLPSLFREILASIKPHTGHLDVAHTVPALSFNPDLPRTSQWADQWENQCLRMQWPESRKSSPSASCVTFRQMTSLSSKWLPSLGLYAMSMKKRSCLLALTI